MISSRNLPLTKRVEAKVVEVWTSDPALIRLHVAKRVKKSTAASEATEIALSITPTMVKLDEYQYIKTGIRDRQTAEYSQLY